MGGPLEGVKVLEWGHWHTAPAAGSLLGDLGAEVIKIEPLTGDPVRGQVLMVEGKPVNLKRKFGYESVNRNKMGIALDIQKKEAKEIVYKLVQGSDVFLTSFRLGIAEKQALDYETLTHYNPKIVYAQISGWGPEGPLSKEPAMEGTAMGVAGTYHWVGGPETQPMIWLAGLGDELSGIITCLAVVAALYARSQQGIGQKIDTSILGSLITQSTTAVSSLLISGIEFPRRSRHNIGNPLINHYKCSDNKWIIFYMLQADFFWPKVCVSMGIKELQYDPRFKDQKARAKNAEEFIQMMDKIFLTRTRDEWLAIFRRNGLICAPVQTIPEAINDPQILANDYIVNYDHPVYGAGKLIGFPYRFSKTPASIKRPPPELGQHTEEILLELGYTWDDIAEFKDGKIIP